nr:hypothetical protein [Tanacetum cinerariifolium]
APKITTGSPSTMIITESPPAVFTTSSESQTPPPDIGVTGIKTPFPTCDNNVFKPYIASEASFSNTLNVEVTLNSPITHVQKWTKDHLLKNVIGDLHQFERLDVWVLVPCPDNILIIPLKWIFKIKLDEYGEHALNATVRYVRMDNEMEFVNKTLIEFFESVGITHNTSVPRSPQQNDAKAVVTACYTLNRSLVHTLHGKTYYELIKGKEPELKYFRVLGSLCYPTNDYDDLGKLKAKAHIVQVSSLTLWLLCITVHDSRFPLYSQDALHALNATVRYVRMDNEMEFVNKTLIEFFESVGITHNTSVPRSPQQNDVVERRNRALMEAARTMLIFAKA